MDEAEALPGVELKLQAATGLVHSCREPFPSCLCWSAAGFDAVQDGDRGDDGVRAVGTAAEPVHHVPAFEFGDGLLDSAPDPGVSTVHRFLSG
ncbi:hypothetical protein Ae168Ps1_6452 [Pseudonocardia sp. Ae168_Ps1]|nr:hypothetical protein Ae168Ps1_6452 [Pseudonocardia sp. Ae168_Ps1]OLL89042.1 hypothetical protein Ae356Ps1_6323c [Pseudonocardia sp. Ae356_Ps1]